MRTFPTHTPHVLVEAKGTSNLPGSIIPLSRKLTWTLASLYHVRRPVSHTVIPLRLRGLRDGGHLDRWKGFQQNGPICILRVNLVPAFGGKGHVSDLTRFVFYVTKNACSGTAAGA